MRAAADSWTWTLGDRGPPENVEVTGKGRSTEEESHICYLSGSLARRRSVAEALPGRLDPRSSSYIELETVVCMWSMVLWPQEEEASGKSEKVNVWRSVVVLKISRMKLDDSSSCDVAFER